MKGNTVIIRRLKEAIENENIEVAFLHAFKGLLKTCVYEVIDEYFQSNKRFALPQQKNEDADEWLSTTEAKKLLGVKSKSKMQKLRDNGEITFSQHGRIIKYSRKSIMGLLDRHVVNIHQPLRVAA